jgi:Domain of unknown function (DUF5753)
VGAVNAGPGSSNGSSAIEGWAAAQQAWGISFGDEISPDYRQLVGLEQQADAIDVWDMRIIPGLLQTEDYARAVIEGVGAILTRSSAGPMSAEYIERLVKIRMLRQQVLERHVRLNFTLDESVLERLVGDADTMRAQMARLLDVAQRDNITIRVLPSDAPHGVFGTGFGIFRRPARHVNGYGKTVVAWEMFTRIGFADDPDEVGLYERIFAHVTEGAVPPQNSATLIRLAGNKWLAGSWR